MPRVSRFINEPIDIEYLRRRLAYNHETGLLTWREYAQHGRRWNICYAGKPAIASLDGRGYLQGAVDSIMVKAHRVAWAIHHGDWPIEVDHINRIKSDNRIINLRAVSHAVNCRNMPESTRNKSGIAGVCFDKASNKWMAYIKTNGKQKHLGYFTEFDAAVFAREAANIFHGFNVKYGAHS